MNDRIRHLLDQMSALEGELALALHEQETSVLFQINGKRVEFEQSIREAHRRLKTGFFRWLVAFRPQNLVTGPIIYSMIFPLAILDLFVSFYQATCFPIYGVAKVHRAEYIVFDRQQLEYLNFVENTAKIRNPRKTSSSPRLFFWAQSMIASQTQPAPSGSARARLASAGKTL